MSRILVTGLNPAWQKIIEFDQLKPGQVNRAVSACQVGSGKGLNTALVLHRLGHDVSLLQVLGGENGRRFREFCQGRGLATINVEATAETRVCSTLIDRSISVVTELVEPFEVQPAEKVEARIIVELQAAGSFDALVVSGTMPAGLDPHLYQEIASLVSAPLTVLDLVREMSPELLSLAQVAKVNAQEFSRLGKSGLDWRNPATSWPTLFVTDGPRRARMLDRVSGQIRETRFELPRLDGVRNPIGAGDTVTAYLTHCLLSGVPKEQAFIEALAAGSASCLTLLPAEYDESIRQEIRKNIHEEHE